MSEDIYFVTNETAMILAFSCKRDLVDKTLDWDCINLFSSTEHRANHVPTSCFSMLISKHFETKEKKQKCREYNFYCHELLTDLFPCKISIWYLRLLFSTACVDHHTILPTSVYVKHCGGENFYYFVLLW